jgi:hypothetical protein
MVASLACTSGANFDFQKYSIEELPSDDMVLCIGYGGGGEDDIPYISDNLPSEGGGTIPNPSNNGGIGWTPTTPTTTGNSPLPHVKSGCRCRKCFTCGISWS